MPISPSFFRSLAAREPERQAGPINAAPVRDRCAEGVLQGQAFSRRMDVSMHHRAGGTRGVMARLDRAVG